MDIVFNQTVRRVLDAKSSFDQYLAEGDHFRQMAAFTRENVDIAIILSIAYVALVFKGQEWMKNREPLYVKPFFIAWNLFLALFSMLGTPIMITTIAGHIQSGGLRYTICEPWDPEFKLRAFRAWIAIFCLSKVPELMDTAFLVMKKKPVIFLHWYHHFTVLLYCWVALGEDPMIGAYFAAMNFFVHSIMYVYFGVASINHFMFKLVKPFGILVTLLQISQMVAGLVLIALAAYWRLADPRGCPGTSDLTIRSGLLMYVSYFVLFVDFFYKNYMVSKPKKAVAKADENASGPTVKKRQ